MRLLAILARLPPCSLAVLLVLQAVHELLRTGTSATQRDLYYRLKRPPLVRSPHEVNTAIQVQGAWGAARGAWLPGPCAASGSPPSTIPSHATCNDLSTAVFGSSLYLAPSILASADLHAACPSKVFRCD